MDQWLGCEVNNAAAFCAAALDAAGAVVILLLMVNTTPEASWGAFFHRDGPGFWAMQRRIVYSMVAIALFTKAMMLADYQLARPWAEVLASAIVILGILYFPWIRAMGAIDKDRWVGFRTRDQ